MFRDVGLNAGAVVIPPGSRLHLAFVHLHIMTQRVLTNPYRDYTVADIMDSQNHGQSSQREHSPSMLTSVAYYLDSLRPIVLAPTAPLAYCSTGGNLIMPLDQTARFILSSHGIYTITSSIGNTENTGDNVTIGDIGSTGSAGSAGNTEDSEDTGYTGHTGYSDDTGDTGSSGNRGGTTGPPRTT